MPAESGIQAQKALALEAPVFPERLNWPEALSASSLWDEVTILRSQLQSQAQVRQGVYIWGLCECVTDEVTSGWGAHGVFLPG